MKVFTFKQLAACGCLLVLGSSALLAADNPPDFTGVWTNAPAPAGGRAAPPAPMPLLPAPKARVEAYQNLVRESGATPGGSCLGTGMPGSMMGSGGYPMEIIQRPEQITVIYEAHTEVRRLYFKDKIIPAADRVPARNGYSTARWQGETLIVDTDTLKEQQDTLYPHSDQAHIVEIYRLETDPRGAKVLVANWELIDPLTYAKPVKATKKWLFDPKGILLPYECDEEGWLDHLEALKNKSAVPDRAYKN